MAVIKSGATTDQLTVDPASKAARVTLYDTSGNASPTVPVSFPAGASIELLDSGGTNKASISAAGAVKVDGSATTQPVSATSLPLPSNAAIETGGNLATIAAAMTNGTAKTQTVNGLGVVADVTAKGTQGANALATQDLKDGGRVVKLFTATFTPAAAEALVTLTPVSDGVSGATNTSFGVTAGKRLRIQALILAVENTTAAIRGCQVALRMSSSGAVTAASPLIAAVGATTAAATLQLAASQAQSFPDGVELSGTMQLGVSAIGTALAGSSVTVVGYEY